MKTAVVEKEEAISREKFAEKFVRSYDEAIKIMQKKLPRPHTDWTKEFKQWDKWAKEY
jgi:hypothetical protein